MHTSLQFKSTLLECLEEGVDRGQGQRYHNEGSGIHTESKRSLGCGRKLASHQQEEVKGMKNAVLFDRRKTLQYFRGVLLKAYFVT